MTKKQKKTLIRVIVTLVLFAALMTAEKAFGVEGALRAQAAAMLAGEKGLVGLLALVTASAEDFNALADAMDRTGSVDFTAQEAATLLCIILCIQRRICQLFLHQFIQV